MPAFYPIYIMSEKEDLLLENTIILIDYLIFKS
jgi:hypothetical protein